MSDYSLSEELICKRCKSDFYYSMTLWVVSRVDGDPACPECGAKVEQTDYIVKKELLEEKN